MFEIFFNFLLLYYQNLAWRFGASVSTRVVCLRLMFRFRLSNICYGTEYNYLYRNITQLLHPNDDVGAHISTATEKIEMT